LIAQPLNATASRSKTEVTYFRPIVKATPNPVAAQISVHIGSEMSAIAQDWRTPALAIRQLKTSVVSVQGCLAMENSVSSNADPSRRA
jgi:hypothetical protein